MKVSIESNCVIGLKANANRIRFVENIKKQKCCKVNTLKLIEKQIEKVKSVISNLFRVVHRCGVSCCLLYYRRQGEA